jgi:hypothetical protein
MWNPFRWVLSVVERLNTMSKATDDIKAAFQRLKDDNARALADLKKFSDKALAAAQDEDANAMEALALEMSDVADKQEAALTGFEMPDIPLDPPPPAAPTTIDPSAPPAPSVTIQPAPVPATVPGSIVPPSAPPAGGVPQGTPSANPAGPLTGS